MSQNDMFCDQCRFVNKRSTAKFFCQSCLEYYCKKCKKEHHKFRLTMGHLLLNLTKELKKVNEKFKGDFNIADSKIRFGAEQKDTTVDKGDTTYEADVLETVASKRCNISGKCAICVNNNGLNLTDIHGRVLLFWPFTCIRKYGSLDNKIFFFECGRRCDSGEGRFVLMVRDAKNLHKTLTHFIRVIERTVTLNA